LPTRYLATGDVLGDDCPGGTPPSVLVGYVGAPLLMLGHCYVGIPAPRTLAPSDAPSHARTVGTIAP